MLKPLSSSRWDYSTAAHLLNRAGFGGTPAEINQLVALGPEQAVASLLDYENIPDPTPSRDALPPGQSGPARAAITENQPKVTPPCPLSSFPAPKAASKAAFNPAPAPARLWR